MTTITRTDYTGKYREYTGDIQIDCKQFSDHHPRFADIVHKHVMILFNYTTLSERALIKEAFLGHQYTRIKSYFDRWMSGDPDTSYDTVEEFWRGMVAEFRLAPDNEDLARVMKI